MDQLRAQEIAKSVAQQAGKMVNEAVQRVGEQVQPTLDQSKAMVQDLATRASETGRQAVNRTGEFIDGVAPQAKEVASNLYEQGARSGEYLRRTVAQQPLTALLIAGAIGCVLGYLARRS